MTFDPSQGDGAQLLDIMQLQATLAGYSLVDPTEAEVTPGSSDLTVDIAAAPSDVRLGGPAEDFDGADGVELPDPDSDDPRKALVYLDSNGDVQTLGGTPASPVPEDEERTAAGVPTVPVPSEDFLPLAEVWIPAGADDISTGDISSRRMGIKTIVDYSDISNTPESTGDSIEYEGSIEYESDSREEGDTVSVDSFIDGFDWVSSGGSGDASEIDITVISETDSFGYTVSVGDSGSITFPVTKVEDIVWEVDESVADLTLMMYSASHKHKLEVNND